MAKKKKEVESVPVESVATGTTDEQYLATFVKNKKAILLDAELGERLLPLLSVRLHKKVVANGSKVIAEYFTMPPVTIVITK